MIKKTLILIGFAILSQFGFAQTIDNTKLDHYFHTLDANNKFMGSVAISKNGEMIYTKQIGSADFDSKIKHNDKTKQETMCKSRSMRSELIASFSLAGNDDDFRFRLLITVHITTVYFNCQDFILTFYLVQYILMTLCAQF